MRFAFAAALPLFLAGPALSSSAAAMHVGLVVTGSLASSLAGTWDSRTAARGTIYHFVVGGSSGVFYELVSVPLREISAGAMEDALGAAPTAGTCDLRVSGVIYSLERISGGTAATSSDFHLGSSYEMQYSIRSAEAVTSSTDFDGCKEVAASYLSDTPAADSMHSLTLSRTGNGRLIDSATGEEYTRTP